MYGHGSKLSHKKEEAIAALVQRSIPEAAKVVGISPKTLRRWLKVPEFQDAYREARSEPLIQTLARMQQNTGAACIVMLKIIADPKESSAIKLKAAAYILNYSLKGLELDKLESLEVRLSELERAAEKAKASGDK
jgi:hypothetical protein